jgi:uncharacterized membrane protein YfcA
MVIGFETTALIASLFFIVSVFYSSVGQAGASGYLAVMTLFSVPLELLKPVALTLNILVASLTAYRFYRDGHLSWPDIWPLILLSAPFAFLGGAISLPPEVYRPILGVLMLISAAYLTWSVFFGAGDISRDVERFPRLPAFGVGGIIGFVSGLTGIGGGVLLSPALILLGWTNIRRTAAIAATFILCNSTAALAGNVISLRHLPAVIPIWGAAALLGGFIGSKLGSRLLAPKYLVILLILALVAAGLKFTLF